MGIKNVEFYADFVFFKNVFKNAPRKTGKNVMELCPFLLLFMFCFF